MNVTALSLVGLQSNDSIREYLRQHPEMMVELPYNMDESRLEDLALDLEGRVASIHACCPSELAFPNFGSSDEAVIEQSMSHMRRTLKSALRFGASLVVLHPGYATGKSIPSDGEQRLPLLHGSEFRDFVGLEDGSICKLEYTHMDRYRRHFDIMRHQVASLAHEYLQSGVKLALENLNPRAGYLNVEPYEQLELARLDEAFLCLDIGHLWISSQVFGFDFLEAADGIMKTGKVVSVHLHSNPSRPGFFRDSHENLDANPMPVKSALELVAAYKPNLVLETLHDFDLNTELLRRWLDA